mmetsp:Transcript_26491/g.39341  ORF Transcript_26491/g.39341 Transcript_26491/m.39341 type:complete len:114 (+) Transcript_26491:282-623(+)
MMRGIVEVPLRIGAMNFWQCEDDAGLSVPEKCQPQSLITQEDLILCENLCKPALYCYFGDSCSNTINCHDFKFCGHVLSAYLSGVTWENTTSNNNQGYDTYGELDFEDILWQQ